MSDNTERVEEIPLEELDEAAFDRAAAKLRKQEWASASPAQRRAILKEEAFVSKKLKEFKAKLKANKKK